MPFEPFLQKPESEPCTFCGSEETHVWVGDPDEAGQEDILLCDTHYGWSQRLLIRVGDRSE